MKRITAFLLSLMLIFGVICSAGCDLGRFVETTALTVADTTTSPVDTTESTSTSAETTSAPEASVEKPTSVLTFVGTASRSDFVLDYTEEDFQELMADYEALLVAAEKEDLSDREFLALALKVEVKEAELIDQQTLSEIIYYSNTSNDDAYEKYVAMEDYRRAARDMNLGMWEPLYQSRYKRLYFGEMTDIEIEEMIAYYFLTEEHTALVNEIGDMQQQYTKFSDKEIRGKKHDTLYASFVEKQNASSKLYGYANFLEDCYANTYMRDFTPAQTLSYTKGLGENLVPLITASLEALGSDNISDESVETAVEVYSSVLMAPFFTDESMAILDAFYHSMGDEIYSIFRHLIDNGYYYIAEGKGAYDVAFTSNLLTKSEPVMFFSTADDNYYCSLMTFVHEFGHYCNYYMCGENEDLSMELAETHSQGAEWLFLSYLKNCLMDDADAAEWLIDYYFYDSCTTVLYSALVGAFEATVYPVAAEAGTTKDMRFDQIMKDLVEETIGKDVLESLYSDLITPAEYYRYVVIESPGYYISYSLSQISAFEIYSLAENNYEETVERYIELLRSEETYVKSLNDAGIGSPFDSETYVILAQALFGTASPVTP